MVIGVAVGEAEVQSAGVTDDWHKLLLLALSLVAAVCKHLLLGIGLAACLYVGRDCKVRQGAPLHWDWGIAEGAHRHLDILLVLGAAGVEVVLKVVLAE